MLIQITADIARLTKIRRKSTFSLNVCLIVVLRRRYMVEILPIRFKTPSNQ